jgi:hypothetical protein
LQWVLVFFFFSEKDVEQGRVIEGLVHEKVEAVKCFDVFHGHGIEEFVIKRIIVRIIGEAEAINIIVHDDVSHGRVFDKDAAAPPLFFVLITGVFEGLS